MLQCIKACHHAPRAMAEKKYGELRLPRFCQAYERTGICDIVVKRVDVEPFPVRLPAAPEVHRVGSQACGCELLASPRIIAAVRIEAGDDRNDATGLAPRPPGSYE